MKKNQLKKLTQFYLNEILDNDTDFNSKGFKLIPDKEDDENRIYSYKVKYAPKLSQIRSKINDFKKEFEFYELNDNEKISELSSTIIKYLGDISKLILGLDRLIKILKRKRI